MKSVLMLLANGVEPLEMAAFTDVLGWADLLGDDSLELVNAGLRKRIVTTFGITICPSFLLSDLDTSAFDALALPGGFEPAGFYEEALSEPFLATIRDFVDAGKIVASVCVASVCLGAAGVLRGKTRRRTTKRVGSGKINCSKLALILSIGPLWLTVESLHQVDLGQLPRSHFNY